MESRIEDILRWFGKVGDRYVASYLSGAPIDVDRLRSDPEYGIKLFFAKWAYERSGAPRGYRIAAVKAISAAWPDMERVVREFQVFFQGKRNELINPILDPRLASINIPTIVTSVEQGNLAGAFNDLQLRGVGHKLKAFFLRDLATITGSDNKICTLADNLYCQPIDVWVRFTVRGLDLPEPTVYQSIKRSIYGFEELADFKAAVRLIHAALQVGISPLRVNQGIWYFCSNAVGDQGRLTNLLNSADAKALSQELELMQDFLP